MHENAPILQATRRDRVGSRYSKRLREQGKLPAILYGHGEEPVPVAFDANETISHIRKGEKVFRIEMDGSSGTALLRDLQFDYLGSNIIHADFARVDLNERVHSSVRVRLIGDAVGLKQAGAILMHPVTEIDVECVLAELPDFIEVDVADLDAGHAIYVRDVQLPSDSMKLLSDPNGVVAQIVIQAAAKTAEEEAAPTEAAQPEVITEKKEEKEEGGKE
jgi:large subunit ribosomal protein L25